MSVSSVVGRPYEILRAAIGDDPNGPLAMQQMLSRDHFRYALYHIAERMQPRVYLEIGVRRGWSLMQVAAASPNTRIIGVDMWKDGYGGNDNPGPDFVRAEMARIVPEFRGELELISGDSHQVLPELLARLGKVDLVCVDGDHSIFGAMRDLLDVMPYLAHGGLIVFDDLDGPADGGGVLHEAWARVRDAHQAGYTFEDCGSYGLIRRKAQGQTAIISHWRNDAEKSLEQRAAHLFNKTGDVCHVMVVGDSDDSTLQTLVKLAEKYIQGGGAAIVRDMKTGIEGDDPDTRLKRLSATLNYSLALVPAGCEYVMLHESDLISPANIVEMFLANPAALPGAGWVTLGDGDVFYDTWAYRRNGTRFTNDPPYHPCYQPARLFEVDSAGSVLMFHAEDVCGPNGARCETGAIVEICDKLRQRGRQIWVHPQIRIVQPLALWKSQQHGGY